MVDDLEFLDVQGHGLQLYISESSHQIVKKAKISPVMLQRNIDFENEEELNLPIVEEKSRLGWIHNLMQPREIEKFTTQKEL